MPSIEAASVVPTSVKRPGTELVKLDVAVETETIVMSPPVIRPSIVIPEVAVAWPDSLLSLAVAASVTLPLV